MSPAAACSLNLPTKKGAICIAPFFILDQTAYAAVEAFWANLALAASASSLRMSDRRF
ncbi:MAG: hypothetical protein JWQ94_989 [Tardiphaga sp.]|jgi:hypothetical protein|nr:hypothetical protein [Tardiphaga sp.]